jgi:hypothetical protein
LSSDAKRLISWCTCQRKRGKRPRERGIEAEEQHKRLETVASWHNNFVCFQKRRKCATDSSKGRQTLTGVFALTSARGATRCCNALSRSAAAPSNCPYLVLRSMLQGSGVRALAMGTIWLEVKVRVQVLARGRTPAHVNSCLLTAVPRRTCPG